MAVPKRRVSKSRSAKRRTHYKIKLARPIKENGEWRMPHRMSKNGEYAKLQ
ncbi:MAG TPA: 50S ribosomal protein L32 [Campylobacterales bacterium]|nr:50S ribosomal protein L32 [Campylobacterales bacterium]HIO70783.1 50S ribosomal protein L32 [Campylobacterales bacterium]